MFPSPGPANAMDGIIELRVGDIACPPGEQTEVRIPLANPALKTLRKGSHALVRCTLLAPGGFRPVTAEIVVTPEAVATTQAETTMTIGPDAVLD